MLMYRLISQTFLSSNEGNLLIIPKTMRKTFGDRAFAKAGPFLWNELPADIRDREASTVETFKSRLKTFLFKLKRHFIFKYNSKF